MPGFVPALFFCAISVSNALTCRTTAGAEIKLREGSRTLEAPKALSIVDVRDGAFCAVLEGGVLGCFDGDGKRFPFKETGGREIEIPAREDAALSRGRACVLDAQKALHCYDLGGTGKEREFESEGRVVSLTDVSRFVLSESLLCVRGKSAPLSCFPFTAGSDGRLRALTFTNSHGRRLEPAVLAASDFAVDGSLVCFQRKPGGLSCHEANGAPLILKNKVGFPDTVDASGGIFLSSRLVCGLDAASVLSCHLRADGSPVEFKNALGFKDVPPRTRMVLTHGDTLCALPRPEKNAPRPALVCYFKEGRVEFKSTSGGRASPGEDSPLTNLLLSGNLLCGANEKSLLRCWKTSGEAVDFRNSLGFSADVDAARRFSVGPEGVCAVSAAKDARCFRRTGEEIELKDGLVGGGNTKVRLAGIEALNVAQ